MAKFLTICLLWVNSLTALCAPPRHPAPVYSLINCSAVFRPCVRTATYSTQIDFYKKHISGLFVFKAINDTTERIVFITETGFKFFDLEFTPHSFAVKYIIPGLNKKIIVNTFKKDLGYLVEPPSQLAPHELMPGSEGVTVKLTSRKVNTYYTADKECNKLQKIEAGRDNKKSLVIDLVNSQNNAPQTINIAHKNIKLTIFMKQIIN